VRSSQYDVPMKRLRGDGIYRRFLDVRGQEGLTTVHLEDDFHAFEATVAHREGAVVEVRGHGTRIPWTPCNGAAAALRALVGAPLHRDLEANAAGIELQEQCTHLLDAACLAMACARAGVATRRYAIAVGEPADPRREARISREGEEVFAWELEELLVRGPAPFDAVPLLGEPFRAALRALPDDDAREAAWLLRRGVFVSYARLYDMDRVTDVPGFGEAIGASCHTFRPGVVEGARRVVGATVELTDTPEGP